MSSHYRYPGVKPFSQQDSHLFFGRKQDIQQLVRYLRTTDLVVLHGKSGLGKTSLIQAGVIPQLNSNLKKTLPFEPITIRLNSYNPRNPQSLSHSAEVNIEREKTFLDDLPVKYISIWHALRSRQLADGAPGVQKRYLLIFDQFEELFTYPDEEVEAFGHDLADLYNRVVPGEFRKVLRREEVVNEALKQRLDEPGMREWLNGTMEVKILIAIRSDKFNLLDRLSPYIPDILLNSRILEALNREQAGEAIEHPAEMTGEFESPTFTYSDSAKSRILDFLTSGNQRRVEGFQLQILCRNIEESLIDFAASGKQQQDGRIQLAKTSGNGEGYVVEDVDSNFGDILRTYYDEQINKLGEEEDIRLARMFIEDELIADGRRVSMDRAAIKSGVSEELLEKLVKTRLIRSEPNSQGGLSYEISHDTLLEPIMGARQERKIVEEAEARQQEAREAELQRQKELEAERDAREKELAQARAEKAEIEKQRALETSKAERRNKYFILTLLALVVVFTANTWWTLDREREQNRMLLEARDTLQNQSEILQRELGLNQQALDSVLSNNSSLPKEQRQALERTANFNRILTQIRDSLPAEQGKAFLRFDELVIRMNIDFPPNNRVPDAQRVWLEKVAKVLAQYPKYMIDIQVHTDRFGSARNNALLSSNRAEDVLGILSPIIDGPSERLADRTGRISVSGKGETMPISETDRGANKRVDIVLCEQKETR